MSTERDILTQVRDVNPVPDLDRFDPDEAAAGVAAIEAAWNADRQASTAAPLTPRTGRRTPHYAMVFAVAAALALIIIGGPILWRGARDAPVVDTPTTTTPPAPTTLPPTTVAAPVTTIAPVTPAPTVPLPPMPGIAFTQSAETTFDAETTSMESMIVGGPGLVAVGMIYRSGVSDGELTGNLDGAVWVSDGTDPWVQTGDPTVFTSPDDTEFDGSNQWPFAVTNGPLGLVAVGEDNFDGAVWRSSDGYEWSRVSRSDDLGGNDAQFLNAVIYGGPGLVAVGRDGFNAGAWTSQDADTWTRINDPALIGDSEPARIWDVVASPGGLFAIGSIGFEEGFDQAETERLAGWTSTDGTDWERLPDEIFETLGITEISSIEGGDQFLIIGATENDQGMWTSDDGHTWDTIDVSYMGTSDETGTIDHIGTQWDGTRWVTVGIDYLTGTVSASFQLDVPWQPVGAIDPALFADGYEPDQILTTNTGIIIIATNEADDTIRSTTLIGTWNE